MSLSTNWKHFMDLVVSKDINYLFCIFISKLISYYSLPDNLILHPFQLFFFFFNDHIVTLFMSFCFYKSYSFYLECSLFSSFSLGKPFLSLWNFFSSPRLIWLLFILQDIVCTDFLYNAYQNILQFLVFILSSLVDWIWMKSVSLSLYLWYPASVTLKIIKNVRWINEWLNYVRKIILVHGIQSILEPGNLIV